MLVVRFSSTDFQFLQWRQSPRRINRSCTIDRTVGGQYVNNQATHQQNNQRKKKATELKFIYI
jgi:hypothetical protein